MWLTALPTLILNSKKEDTEISLRDYVGWSMWLVGMLIEAIADYQKYIFRSNPANRSAIMAITHGGSIVTISHGSSL